MNTIFFNEEAKLVITLHREPLDTLSFKVSKSNSLPNDTIELFLTNLATKATYGMTLEERDFIGIVEKLAMYYNLL